MKVEFNENGSPRLKNLISEDGLYYEDFKKSLKIKYKIILFDLCLIVSMIISGFFLFENLKNSSQILYFVCHFVWNSFWFASYLNFFHESSHYNLHHNKKINDMLATFLFSLFNGQDIKNLRITHWQHHKYLGATHDTENSYSEPLSFSQIIKVLLFIFTFQKILIRNNYLKTSKKKIFSKLFFISIFFHLGVTTLIIFVFGYFTAVVWVYTFLTGVPLFFKIRQTLEHRNVDHDKTKSFINIDHGPINRLFKSNFFSRFFGSAGFNKHLLHHWDPSLSYTNFREFENFLLKTKLKEQILNSKSNYNKIFSNLIYL